MKEDSETEYIINDEYRYRVKIPHFYRYQDHIIYEVKVMDTAFMYQHSFYFRFKALKLLDRELRKRAEEQEIYIPEFPKTRSIIFFWNKTN